MNRLGTQKGFSLVSVLAVVVIGGLLYAGYLSLMSGKSTVPESSGSLMSVPKSTACEMNRNALKNALLSWSVRNPGKQPSIRGLEASGVTIPQCPDGGRFQLKDDKVVCSMHSRR